MLLFDFDGTLYTGDLPVLAYARHVTDFLDHAAATSVIDGIREFLEGKHSDSAVRLLADVSAAADGYQAVELLAAAAGLDPHQVHLAYRAARAGLAASAFALDPVPGLVELLAEFSGRAYVVVVTNADPDGIAEVLVTLGLAELIDEVITDAGKPAAMPDLVRRLLARTGGRPDRLLAVGDRWATDLAAAHAAGCATALVDRFGRGDGDPTWRADATEALVPVIRSWAQHRLVERPPVPQERR